MAKWTDTARETGDPVVTYAQLRKAEMVDICRDWPEVEQAMQENGQ